MLVFWIFYGAILVGHPIAHHWAAILSGVGCCVLRAIVGPPGNRGGDSGGVQAELGEEERDADKAQEDRPLGEEETPNGENE